MRLIFKNALSGLAILSLAVSANAATTKKSSKNKTAVKQSELKKEKEAEENTEITNKKLLAELGSKSKYSMSFSLNYSGGSIDKPFSKDRPNLGNAVVPPAVNLSAGISGRLRLSKSTSVTAGFGVAIVQPFHEAQADQGHDKYLDKWEVSDPNVGYSSSAKLGSLMVINGATLTYYTNQRSTAVKSLADLTLSNVLVLPVGKTGWQLGLANYIWGASFEGSRNDKGVDVRDSQADFGVATYPFAEYTINDTFNFRTVFQQFNYYHTRTMGNLSKLQRSSGAQSVGLGISVNRDVFLYPNFQFSTENLSTEWLRDRFVKESTVGMSATINAF